MFAGLWLTGIELNITAIMGMTMIIGIGTVEFPLVLLAIPVLIGLTLPRAAPNANSLTEGSTE